MTETKSVYYKVDTDFSDAKLKKAYAELRKAFDKAAEVRAKIIDPAMKKFDDLLKDKLVANGEAESPEYLQISHRYGLAFTVLDEPVEEKQKGSKRRVVSV